MKKKFLSLFTVIVALLLAVALLACEDYNKDEDKTDDAAKTTYTHTITNGTFYDASTTATANNGDKAVLDKVNNWTRTSGSLSSDKGGQGGVFVSAINLADKENFDVLAGKYFEVSPDAEAGKAGFKMSYPGVDKHTPMVNDLDKDGQIQRDENDEVKKKREDTNALVVASVEQAGSVYASSSTATLAANSRYLLQFSVASMVDAEEGDTTKGAWFVVKGDVEYTVKAINTKGEWKTYYLFIETNKTNSMSISVELWLGYGPKTGSTSSYATDGKDIYATKGIALFDNVLCEKVDDDKLATAIASEENVATYTGYVYDENAEAVDNFAAFKANIASEKDALGQKYVTAKSAYYLSNPDMELRNKPTSYTTNSYRKYFYTFRENYNSENLKKYSITSSSKTDNGYYGSVDVSKLYNTPAEDAKLDEFKDNYSSISDFSDFNAMSYTDWRDKVMKDANHNLSEMDEQYVMMIYNNELKSNTISTNENIVIDSNKYYVISVWAYVWAKEYTRGGNTYFYPEYKDTTKDKAPVDPLDKDNKKLTEAQIKIYNSVVALVDENESEGKIFHGYKTLSAKEREDFKGFDVQAAKDALKDYLYAGNETLKTDVANWIRGILGEGADFDVNGMDETFYFFYLKELVDGKIEGKTAPANLTNETNKAHVNTLYWSERITNVDEYDTAKTKVEEYEKDKKDWDAKESDYNNKWSTWTAANPNGPYATVNLTGVESVKDKDQKATVRNEWQKLTFYVKGNQLSKRNLKIEMSMGKGTDASTYMIGGAFFDSINVKEYATEEAARADGVAAGISWEVLADIDTDASNTDFGGLTGDKKPEELTDAEKETIIANWEANAADGTASGDKNSVNVTVTDAEMDSVTIGGTKKYLYALNYTNAKPTASTLTYKGDEFVEILPNKFYRLAFLVKTDDKVSSDLGITIKLVTGKDKDDLSVLNTSNNVTKYTTKGEWKEVVYYICGDLVDTYYAAIEIEMGSGTRFVTDSYVEGTVSLAAFNCLTIDYTEYNSASTGDKIVSGVSLYNISTALDNESKKFDNGYYSKIDYKETKEDQFTDGKLSGMGTTSNWTSSLVSNKFEDAPKNVTFNKATRTLSWDTAEKYTAVSDSKLEKKSADKYEIWMKYTDEKDKSVEKIFDVVNGDVVSYTFEEAYWADKVNTSFAVKAIADDGVSSLSTYTSNGLGNAEGSVYPTTKDGISEAKAKAGTILASNAEAFGDATVDGINYVSPYKTVMKLTSSYNSVLSVSSKTLSGGLSSGEYYKISVWVKTEPGTKASITLTDTSGALQASTNDSQLGFVQIDTDGKWEEYCIYVKTGNFSAKMAIRYSIGNPYAKTQTRAVNADKKSAYMLEDLSKGNAYFDAVRVTSIGEEEYAAAVELDNNKASAKYAYANHEVVYTDVKYYIYTMQYTMDSFDVSTEPSSTSVDNEKKGNTPSNYEWGYDKNLTSTGANAIYGVFNYESKDTDERMATAIKNLYSYNDTSSDDDDTVYALKEAFKQAYGDALKINDKTVDNWEESDWSAFIEEFLSIESEDGYDGGANVLAMSNKLQSGFAQHYSVSSSYNYTAKAGTYAKLTFTARTLIAAITGSSENEGAKQYTYSADNAFGELRVTPSSSKDDTVRVKISSKQYGKNGLYDDVTYTVYLYNPTTSDNTVNWAFYLGDEKGKDTKEEDWYAHYLIGLMAIDLVSVESATKDEYDEAVAAAKGDNAKVYTYEYTEKKADDSDDDDDTDDEDKDKESFWDRLVKNEYFWLYISSFVIALVIIAAVIAVLVTRWKKKHPKEVVVENVAKTEKDVKVVPPAPQVKEDALEMDEYVDEPQKANYVQRVNKNKSRKNRKNGKK